MQIGELSARSGLSRDALRFYEKRGLIRANRGPNGYRRYPEGTLFILNYVSTAQRLGFSLTEIAAELPSLSGDGITSERIAEVLREKIALVDARIAELANLRADLAARLDAACPLVRPT